MPRKAWESPDAKCPFYKLENKRQKTICCEGIFSDSTVTHKFRYKRDREKQLALYCAADFSKCEIYRAVMEAKYPD